jgi:hypothetical protein
MNRWVVVIAILAWGIAFFFVPFIPGFAVGAAAYLVLVDRANHLTDDYLEARAATSPDPFAPPPLHRPWYRDRLLTGSLQRLSANLALHERQRNPTIDALRRRASRAYWIAAFGGFGGMLVGMLGQGLIGKLWL